MKALRTIKYCAIAIIGFVAVSVVFFLFSDSDDRPAGVFMRILIAGPSIVVAIAAATFERICRLPWKRNPRGFNGVTHHQSSGASWPSSKPCFLKKRLVVFAVEIAIRSAIRTYGFSIRGVPWAVRQRAAELAVAEAQRRGLLKYFFDAQSIVVFRTQIPNIFC